MFYVIPNGAETLPKRNALTLSSTRARLGRFLSRGAAFLFGSFRCARLRLTRERFGRCRLTTFFLQRAHRRPRTLRRSLPRTPAFPGIAQRLSPRARAGLRGIRRRQLHARATRFGQANRDRLL